MTQGEKQLLVGLKLLAGAVRDLGRYAAVPQSVALDIERALDQVDALYALATEPERIAVPGVMRGTLPAGSNRLGPQWRGEGK